MERARRHRVPYVERSKTYDPTNLLNEGTLRARTLFGLLRRQGVRLTRGRLLDLGCGYGGLSIYAARAGASVTAADVHSPSLAVVARRLREEGLDARGGHARGAGRVLRLAGTELPFASATFEQAVTLGVIEWTPLTALDGDPRAVQLRVLREVRRTLTTGGTYVLGTKNRWFPKYALRDAQVRWPLVNHLPRRLARFYSAAVYRKEYRTYIHSLREWESMLYEVGFTSVEAFLPLHHYQFPLALIPARGPFPSLAQSLEEAARWLPPEYLAAAGAERGLVKRGFLPLVYRTRLAPTVWPALLFVARV